MPFLVGILCILLTTMKISTQVIIPSNYDSCFPTVTTEDLEEFKQLYTHRPIKQNVGGMKAVAMFWVWFVTKYLQPGLIIESGVWHGQSTWLLEQAAPHAQIICIEPALERIRYRSKKAFYTREDFSTLQLPAYNPAHTLCFFDDHQNAFFRIQQVHKKGLIHCIFDDNYPVGFGSHITCSLHGSTP